VLIAGGPYAYRPWPYANSWTRPLKPGGTPAPPLAVRSQHSEGNGIALPLEVRGVEAVPDETEAAIELQLQSDTEEKAQALDEQERLVQRSARVSMLLSSRRT